MTDYINCGATILGGHDDTVRPKTKKALRDALKADPASVIFDATSAFGKKALGQADQVRGDEIPPGVSLSVCGPDPYTARNWWAQVTRDATGRVKLT